MENKMASQFVYSTTPSVPEIPGPIFPDFDPNSPMSQKMIRAKQLDDGSYWTTMREVFAHDFQTLPKERFKVWASTLNVPFICRTRYMRYMAAASDLIVNDPKFFHALQEPMVGCTPRDYVNFLQVFDDYHTSYNRIIHAGHLKFCGYTSEQLANMDTIVELGAGIGDMADIIHKLGFKGKYIIYDFPEIGAVQKWYHNKLGHKNIVHTSSVEDLEDADLCIGTFSLTEMPVDLRNDIVGKIKNTKNWLISFSRSIFGIDNVEWIDKDLVPLFTNHDVEFQDIESMPWHGGARYLTIKQKSA